MVRVRLYHAISIVSLLLVCICQDGIAQPVLNFKRLINNWPTIELYFTVDCNGHPAYFTDKKYFKVHENGVEQNKFELVCPDVDGRCAISVALVVDVSANMLGEGISRAKDAGHALFDEMDGVSDEAAIVVFDSTATTLCRFTIYKDVLHSAIDTLAAGGAAAVWDGVYAGVREVIEKGVNQCRGVLVLTNGKDSVSKRTPAEIIALADSNRMRVYCIGVGSEIDSVQLAHVATTTGGKYYNNPSAGQLAQIYREISTIVPPVNQECYITYTAKCMDGVPRTVDLSIVDFCNGSDTKTKTYVAPKDTSTFIPLRIELGRTTVRGDTLATVPLVLKDVLQNETFHPATFTILFDEVCTSFINVRTPPGSLLEGVPITLTAIPGGVAFTTNERKILSGSGTLAELTFRSGDPLGKDTVCCPLQLRNWIFDAGCYRAILKDGEMCITPRQPVMHGAMSALERLVWDRSLKTYTPDPFSIRISAYNAGNRAATNARFHITYDTSALSLVAPVRDTQDGNPPNVDPGDVSDARWDITAKPQCAGDTVEVCVIISFDNHDEIECCTHIIIPPAEAVLACTLRVPEFTTDTVNIGYLPMPFDLLCLVTNEGVCTADTVFASVVLPAGGLLRLAGPDAPSQTTKRAEPPFLNPGGQGAISWMMTHPITPVPIEYTVGVWVYASNADSVYCESIVRIPGISLPLKPQIVPDGPLAFCEGGSVVLDAGAGYASYRWTNGETTRTITVTTSGVIGVVVMDSAGLLGVAYPVAVTVHALPAPRIAYTGSPSFCEGDTLVLDAGKDFASYRWSDGRTTRSIPVTTAGIWYVDVVSTEGCRGRSDTMTTAFLPAPPVPAISRNGDVLTTGYAHGYQWFRDGVPIPGATDQSFLVTVSGRYTVAVINEHRCARISAPFEVETLPVDPISNPRVWSLEVFPDPSQGCIEVKAMFDRSTPATYTVFTIYGSAVRTISRDAGDLTDRFSLDLNGISSGVYMLAMTTPHGMVHRKFVKI